MVAWALERLRHYLFGQKFTVVSDCNAVAALKSYSGSAQLCRWWDRIAEFDFVVRHRPGTSMQHPDALSRSPVEEGRDLLEKELPTDLVGCSVLALKTEDNMLRVVQMTDEKTTQLIRVLEKPKEQRTSAERGMVES